MVQVLITQHGDQLIAHVVPNQKEFPDFARNPLASFNVSQIYLTL